IMSSLNVDKALIMEFGASYMFYIEKHKLMEIMSRVLAEIAVQGPVHNVRRWLAENIRRIALDIYSKAMDAFHRDVAVDYYQLPKNFFHRIVLHGRPGSGRRTLAHVLAERWNLLIVDADVLAYHYINGHRQDEDAQMLQGGIERDCVFRRSLAIGNIIQKRLLQEDAVYRGWILYNYPNNRCEARELFENFPVPPNRLIYLQIDERMARMRLMMCAYKPSPQHNVTYIDRQMHQFRKSEAVLNTYLSHRREVLYVDATACFETVKCQIMSQLTKTPYMLGYKYAEANALD
ncbi:hypothetical protein KR222_004866, partial [Zaprionus bogoriensis]